jgi:uncharacterized protein YdeI (YjbR/CyaY-like superfamily)
MRFRTTIFRGGKTAIGIEVIVPPDLAATLDRDANARAYFDGLSYSNKLRHVLAIEDAKTAETRQRRIEKSVSMLHEGRS